MHLRTARMIRNIRSRLRAIIHSLKEKLHEEIRPSRGKRRLFMTRYETTKHELAISRRMLNESVSNSNTSLMKLALGVLIR